MASAGSWEMERIEVHLDGHYAKTNSAEQDRLFGLLNQDKCYATSEK